MKKHLNLTGLAKHYGVSMTTVQTWLNKGLPYVTQGGNGKPYKFDPAQTDQWHKDNVASKSGGASSKGDYFAEQTRKTKAEADLKELELGKQIGNLIEVDVVRTLLEGVVVQTLKKFEGMPAKLASAVVACNTKAEAKAVIEKEVNENLGELVTFDIVGFGSKGARDRKRRLAKVEAPAKATGKRVGRRKPAASKRKR